MDKNEMDEAYMQDAIASAKANGTLHEVNPEDAPAPVKQGFAAKHRHGQMPKTTPDASVTAEDKAFSHVENLLAQREKAADQSRER